MPNIDTTVYSIFAGYIPTLGFKQDDFTMGSKSGPAYNTVNGTRYGGTTMNYGFGLAKDGSVRMLASRIPGSISWFEYSTSIRDVKVLVEDDEALQQMASATADNWYRNGNFPGFNKEQESNALLQDVSRNLGFEPGSITEEIEGSGGYSRGLSKHERPEERDPGAMQGRTSSRWDEGGRLGDTGAGAARGLDIYLRDVQGNILRLDVTEKSLFASDPHHGVNWAESGHTAEEFLGMDRQQQESTLLGFFQGQQNQHWNPMIDSLVSHVEQHGSQSSQRVISELKAGSQNLHNITDDLQRALLEMRGGGQGQGQGGNVAAQRMLRSRATNAIARNAAFPTRNMTNYSHMQEVMAFALHHLGNVVRNFTDRPGVQTPGMTSYPLTPEGSYGATASVGVYHRIHETGADVFQFRDLGVDDVIVVDEAHMSQHFMKEYWLQGVRDQDGILSFAARNQNLLDAASWVSNSADPIHVGEMYSLAQQDNDNSVKVRHSASMMITPESMNEDIDRFINDLVADPQAQKRMNAFLKNKLRNVANLSSPTGHVRSNYNPRGGPMLTADIHNSIKNFRDDPSVGGGRYNDWLAATGAMALTPSQAGFSGRTSSGGITRAESQAMFNYDMGGYGGRTGSSGMQQFGGRANLNAGSGMSIGNYGRTRATGYGTQQGGSVSQDFLPLQNQAYQGAEGGGITNRAMLTATFNRAITGRSRSVSAWKESPGNAGSLLKFLNNPETSGLGAAMAKSQNWHQLAQGMGPDNKYYREGEYTEKSRRAGWGTPNQPQLWAAPYVSIYYPAKQATVAPR